MQLFGIIGLRGGGFKQKWNAMKKHLNFNPTNKISYCIASDMCFSHSNVPNHMLNIYAMVRTTRVSIQNNTQYVKSHILLFY